MKKFYLLLLLGVVGFVISSCQMIAENLGLLSTTDTNAPVYGTFLRAGEDPGFITFSNDQTIDSNLTIQGTVLIDTMDPAFDDNGYGNIRYGTAYRPGIFDVNQVKVSADANYIYVYVAMRGKQYGSVEVAKNNGGWLFANIAIFFGKTNSSPNVTNVGFYSPQDGGGTSGGPTGSLSANLYTTNVELYYGAAVIGNTKPNSGGVWIVSNFWTTSDANRLTNITTNDILSKSLTVGYFGTTTIAFRIPRVGDLANSGSKWWVFMGVQGWEDYGLDTPCPTVNGHLRSIGPFASQYDFRAVDGNLNVPKFVDLVINNPSRQAIICSNRIIDASDMFEITLP
ncbi:MAG: glucodextranase DOMON-like domain-containing protein [Brevinematia bacterium]